jgi:hypothetical protein
VTAAAAQVIFKFESNFPITDVVGSGMICFTVVVSQDGRLKRSNNMDTSYFDNSMPDIPITDVVGSGVVRSTVVVSQDGSLKQSNSMDKSYFYNLMSKSPIFLYLML